MSEEARTQALYATDILCSDSMNMNLSLFESAKEIDYLKWSCMRYLSIDGGCHIPTLEEQLSETTTLLKENKYFYLPEHRSCCVEYRCHDWLVFCVLLCDSCDLKV